MDQAANDERMRRLQRLAYGAGASDAERTAAVAELEALRRERAHPAAVSVEVSRPAHVEEPGTTPQVAHETSDTPSAAPLKWAIVVGAVALVLGVAAGWQLSARVVAEEAAAPTPSPTFDELRTYEEERATWPLAAQTVAATVFDRPASEYDTPVSGDIGMGTGPMEFRLLATRSDGLTVHAARDLSEYCLYVSFGADGAAMNCTTDGRFPPNGLIVSSSVRGGASIGATWRADGTLQFGTLIE